MSYSLTIIVSCYNEEDYIRSGLEDLLEAFEGFKFPWEILVIDDCSVDKSVEIVNDFANKYPLIHLIQNETNKGLGAVYQKGIQSAKTTHIVWFPGDNEINAGSIRSACNLIGTADIIAMYPGNTVKRSKKRLIISKIFVLLVNLITGFTVRYYNGSNLHAKALLETVDLNTSGFSYQTRILVDLISAGASYKEMPFALNYCSQRNRALNLKNIYEVAQTLVKFFYTARIKN